MVSDKTVGMVIGFGLGFVSAYVLIKSGTIPITLDTTKTQRKFGAMSVKDKSEHNPLSGWRPLEGIPSADRLNEFQPIPVNNVETQVQEVAAPGTRYQNDEKIKVVRGPDKRILGYETKRDAKISDV